MKSLFGSRSGTTLVEIIIVSVISLFMILTVTLVFSSFRDAWMFSSVQTDIYLDARRAMNELSRELMEGSSGWTEVFTFLDTATGKYTQGIWLASSRGDLTVAGEDGSSTNNYMHLDVNDAASWRSVVIFCPYESPEGIMQLRRYVDYGPAAAYYSGANIFPLTFVSATPGFLNFLKADGTALNIARAGGTVLANYLGSEDANDNNVLDANENDASASLPMDNEDGVLNYGVNFIKNVGSVNISLFFSKEARGLKESGKVLTTTLRNTVKFRQP